MIVAVGLFPAVSALQCARERENSFDNRAPDERSCKLRGAPAFAAMHNRLIHRFINRDKLRNINNIFHYLPYVSDHLLIMRCTIFYL